MVPPLKLTEVLPGVAVTVPPVQVVEAVGVAATCRPDGKGSVKAAFVNEIALELFRVMVMVVGLPFPCRFAGKKVLLPVTGAAEITSNVASADWGFEPNEEFTVFAGIWLT